MFAFGKFKNAYPNAEKSAYMITTEWDVNTVTWDVGSPWYKGGGDFDVSSEVSNANKSLQVWEHYDVTSMVESYYKNDEENYGSLIKLSDEGVDGGVAYASSDYIRDLKKRPKLTITLDLPSCIKNNGILFRNKRFSLKKNGNSYWLYLMNKEKISFKIFNLQGKLIFSGIEQYKKVVNIPLNNSGCFFVKVTLGYKNYRIKLINAKSE